MSTELYARAKAIFVDAMDRPTSDRAGFVHSACGGDDDLKREVLSWIEASERAGSNFLNESAAKMCLTCEGTFLLETKFCPHCGQPLHDDPRALVGTRLDNLYQIEELLGRGGMGAVYRARHSLLGDLVAIKTLKKELSDDPRFLKRFQREGQAARSFRHPNAVTVHDLRTTPAGLIYMVLEYIDGVTLRKHLRDRGKLSVPEAIALLTPMAGVLDAAHRQGVVHRDMKPENVMVTSDETGDLHVKVLDLGIAKMRLEADSIPTTALTAIGTVLGTPQYMSPEQWGMTPRDGKSQVDGRADIYSLGVMAFEMVTGEWPFNGRSIEEFRTAHCVNPVPLASNRCPDVSLEASQAIATALAKDRDDRWPSAGAFVAALASGATLAVARSVETDPSAGQATVPADGLDDSGRDMASISEERTVIDDVSENPPTAAEAGSPVVAEESSKPRAFGAPAVLIAVVAVGVLVAVLAWQGVLTGTSAIPGQPHFAAEPTAAPRPAIAATTELLRFGLDVKATGDSSVMRVSGSEPLGRIEGFRLVVRPTSSGRIAIIGPNRSNVPTLYLPLNRDVRIATGADVVFPEGTWFGMTGETPSDTLSVVFIPEGAQVPAFAVGAAGRLLLPDEQRELQTLRASQPVTPRFEAKEGVFVGAIEGRPIVADIVVRY